ncbi:hypothetical protein HN371_01715 [Candidatus Poribacteria bacterium]|jgi:glycosyltransferase 2 family protein|nr:hypothetical protein [Candidatus Poribacteria bacterium]MBT5709446.1 hypothetical protein [Candidatus Poribacteria bacterium]MBT7099957.1 hypothetical protein [Candidatus Poribacteria bacterium]MBT7807736.1 hypothetical protein [Candidatus Poribacteria bacterium]
MARWTRAAVVSALGVAVAYFLLRSTSWTTIADGVASLTPARLAIGFALYLLFIGLKAARFASLLGGVTSRRLMYGILCAQTFWSNILPMRAGEVSYVHLVRSRRQASGAGGVASLVVAGILDLWWMLLIAVVVGLSLRGTSANNPALTALTAVAAAGVVGIPVGGVFVRRLPAALTARLGALPLVGPVLMRTMAEFGRQTWSRPLLTGAAFSALALICRYAFQLYLLGTMFSGITWMQGLFALVFAGLANLLPIQGVGNVGSIELPWAWALILVGVDNADAVASGFALHGVVLAYAVATGALSLALLRGGPRAEPAA